MSFRRRSKISAVAVRLAIGILLLGGSLVALFWGQMVGVLKEGASAGQVPAVLGGASVSNAASSGDLPVSPPKNGAPRRIRELAVKSLGGNRGAERVIDVAVVPSAADPDQYDVELTSAVNDSLTVDLIRGGAKTDIYNTMKALFQSGESIASVNMKGTFSPRKSNSYSQEGAAIVIEARLTKVTAEKFDWANSGWAQLFPALDASWLDPSLR